MKASIRRRFPSFFVSLLSMLLFSDILFLLYGGEYLAKQLIPPLPTNRVVKECFSQHTALCENIEYTTSYSPQDVLRQWAASINQNENLQGEIIYHAEKCNESWLGLHYAYFHKRQEPACATMAAWSEGNSHITHVFIQLSWSVCPNVVNKYFPGALDRYFRCFEG